ncbi:acetylornithine deacetylase [Terracidiphilus gabretensis]|jgi:acetylornithine deacetylase|uniref:acetylornithine deacetylase n=1 Tax=Terracidiphilus gabretensis TaxID=1577687 RepID=UPI00071C1E54|nr:acetylornithine deacetylase [Terracidiphilus gabretensis]
MNAAEILRELVAIPTPSAVSNLPLIDWVVNYLQTRGWQASLFPYTDESGIDKANLVARPSGTSTQAAIALAFICHTDTVPFSTSWTEALQLRQEGQFLHGCGACDVKGSLACFLAAVDSISAQQTRYDIALILTADEEIGCKGMERLLAQTNLHIRSAIVSEPTSLRPGIAGKGYGLARITARGAEAHSAFPSEGSSAIVAAAELIVRIQQLETVRQQPPDTLFDPPHTTINVGTIHGGTAKNIVAGECTFLVEWRPTPDDPSQAVLQALQSLAASAETANPRIHIQVELLRAESGFSPSASGPLRQRLEALAPRTAIGISFGSEATRIARVAQEVIVIGPGDMHTAHSDRECVPVAELDEWTAILRSLITRVES